MNTRQLIATLFGAAAAAMGCGGNPPPVDLATETQNRIALCTGGYSASATREIAAEIARRGGRVITNAETEQRGVDTFAFGELRGQDAVGIYNAYVECIYRESATPGPDSQTPRWKYHEIGLTQSGESVVQTPAPGQEKAGGEIQLQIVAATGGAWSSKGTPRWEGWCSGGLRRIGNNTSYTYRFFSEWVGECDITLYAAEGSGAYWWSETYRVHVRK